MAPLDKSVQHRPRRSGASATGLVWLLACLAAASFVLIRGAGGRSSLHPPLAAVVPVAAQQAGPITRSKPIQDVKAGDKVWAYDTQSGQWQVRRVLTPLEHDFEGELVAVTVAGQTVESTWNHPFWVEAGKDLDKRPFASHVPIEEQTRPTRGRWVDAKHLQAGDVLVLKNGGLCPIEMVTVRRASQKVYNLKVEDLHTYAVGEVGIATHNKPCFPPGTPVLMADGSAKPIEQVAVGDCVLARDPTTDEPARPAEVTGLIRDFADKLVNITFEGPSGEPETIVSTRFHPFWTKNRGWVEARELRLQDVLQDERGRLATVSKLKVEDQSVQTYNLSIGQLHTFFVLGCHKMAILVHNAPVVNIGGEGEVPGAINVQPKGAFSPNWGSSGTAAPSGLSLPQLRDATGQRFVVADPNALPFESGSIPKVVTNSVPIDTPPSVYGPSVNSKEVCRVLAPNGEWVHNGVPRAVSPRS